jgi:hypothetical protein
MKITINDLDQDLRDKVTFLDAVKADKKPGYLKYDNGSVGADGINTLRLGEVFDEDSISEMASHRYGSSDNFVSAFDTPVCKSSDAIGAGALLTELQGTDVFQLNGNLRMIKIYESFMLMLDSSGTITKINKFNKEDKLSRNVIDVIHTNFVYRNFGIESITGIEYWDGSAVIATENDGIYCISLVGKDFSLKIKEPNVRGIKLLDDNRTLAVSKNGVGGNVVFYDMRDGTKTAIFGNLGNRYELPSELVSSDKMAFAIGYPMGVSFPDKILHAWSEDEAKLQYDNIDYKVSKNPSDPASHVKFIKACGNFVFIVGERYGHMFAWSYDIKNINSSPDILNFETMPASIDDIKDFDYYGGNYYVAIKNRVFILGPNFQILENYLLKGISSSDRVSFDKGSVYAFDEKTCISFMKATRQYQKTLKFEILNSDYSTNNIDILVEAKSKYQMAFVDATTGLTIVPYFYMKLDEKYHVVKITNGEYKKILMLTSLDNGDSIDSIVIHNNRIFYK